ncbi:MAG: serine/threonine-protein kinase, partial [Thermoanaerobaculia bacterium]
MITASWQQVWEIFEEAVQRPPDGRQSFVDEACGEDDQLRRSVAKLLDADKQTDTLLDHSMDGGLGGASEGRSAGTGGRQPERGTAIGPYRILRQIGQGGMSTVFLADRADDAFPRRVAIKLVRPEMESEAILGRLRTERRILASLDHPYIARLFDGGTTDDGLPYFVMEYVEGVAIDAYCEQNQLSIDERLTLFRKVCAAVHAAHQNLVVHRDIKPSNILVDADGDPKLLDFGIAKLLHPELVSSGLEPTATWHRILTPSYASPEQIRGKLITTVSDVYSLGVLLYQLLTGRLPHDFTGRSPGEIESILTDTEPLPPSVAVAAEPADRRPEGDFGGELRRRLAGDLDAIVLKALRSAPHRRYGSVERLAADVERCQQGLPVEAREGSWRYRTGKFVRRNRRALAGAAAVALLVVGFAVAMALQARRVAFERDQARLERDKKSQVLSLLLEIFEFSNPYVVPGEELTVREALQRSVPVLEGALRDQPDLRAELLHTSGSILGLLDVPDAARDQLEEALKIRRELHGEEHLEVVETLTALAAAYRELGELEHAEELARRSLAIARGLLGDDPSDLVEPLGGLVMVLCYRYHHDAAEVFADELMELVDKLPAGHQRRIAALEYRAAIKNAHGDYRAGARLNQQAANLRRARFGDKHPSLITTLNNLGLSLRRMEDFEAAERTYQEAIELQREVFGEEHDDPYLLNNLAGVRYAIGDYA